MKYFSILAIISVVTIWLSSCQEKVAIEKEPEVEELAEPQPRAVAPVPPELLPVDSAPEPETLPSENMIKQPARFDSVEIIRTQDGPALRLTGHLPDGATRLLPAEKNIREGVLYITLYTERDPEVMGTMALVPFDVVVPLPNPPPAQIMLNDQPVLGSE